MKFARENRLSEWTINGLPARERLQRYLARAYASDALDFETEMRRARGAIFFPVG